PLSSSHCLAFWQVEHLGYSKNKYFILKKSFLLFAFGQYKLYIYNRQQQSVEGCTDEGKKKDFGI
uniref:hypothetical protein n=1 Tax=Candidatus Scatocola faecigallinarum TaxID=2840916 RepID=UPI0040298F57